MYEGRTAAEEGLIFGHENMGIVTEIGEGVDSLEPGDRVSIPFNVATGYSKESERGFSAFCSEAQDRDFHGAAYGYVAMGPYQGGQAEKLRVPWADYNCLKLPDEGHEDSFALLSDIFPTGYHSTEMAGLKPGESIAVFGAGPVGLMAAYSAKLRGASEIYVVDRVSERLDMAEKHCDATPINFDHGDPVEMIKEEHGGMVNRGADCVGYQAMDPDDTDEGDDYAYDPAKENPAQVLNDLIRVVEPTGGLGIVGLYVPEDPGAPDEMAAQGRLGIDFGKFFEKGLKCGTGQCNVKSYNRELRDMIISGRADPSFIVTDREPLKSAQDLYTQFDNREDGIVKPILDPRL